MPQTLRDLVVRHVGEDAFAPPPAIETVAGGAVRPLWSVMIPTFNCASFLRLTLESVLREGLPPDEMQIEVIDDVSTKDDPEAVVRELGGGRVTFHRKPRNEGIARNFNTCIARSCGQLVHILHGDDLVLPGFYAQVAQAARQYPNSAAVFTRCRVVDELGTFDSVSSRMRAWEAPTRVAGDLVYGNPIRTPGVVIRRSFYERHGGFRTDLSHVADWEMWARVAREGGVVALNAVLADYRQFGGNDTSRLARTAGDLRERLRLALLFAEAFREFDFDRCVRDLGRQARRRMQRFDGLGDTEAARANREFYEAVVDEARQRLHDAWDVETGQAETDLKRAAKHRLLRERITRARDAGRQVFIWGAGQAGVGCLHRLRVAGLGADGFIDSDGRKHGQRIEEIAIHGAAVLEGRAPRPYVVIASMYAADIARNLQGSGFVEDEDYCVA